jgi:GTPase SAR1 family protein
LGNSSSQDPLSTVGIEEQKCRVSAVRENLWKQTTKFPSHFEFGILSAFLQKMRERPIKDSIPAMPVMPGYNAESLGSLRWYKSCLAEPDSNVSNGKNVTAQSIGNLTNAFGVYKYAISFFDFGGQKIFDMIHSYYLTQSGIYLLVFDLASFLSPEKQLESLEYLSFWIDTIITHSLQEDVYGGIRMANIFLVGCKDDIIEHHMKIHSNSDFCNQIVQSLRETFSHSVAWPYIVKNIF